MSLVRDEVASVVLTSCRLRWALCSFVLSLIFLINTNTLKIHLPFEISAFLFPFPYLKAVSNLINTKASLCLSYKVYSASEPGAPQDCLSIDKNRLEPNTKSLLFSVRTVLTGERKGDRSFRQHLFSAINNILSKMMSAINNVTKLASKSQDRFSSLVVSVTVSA